MLLNIGCPVLPFKYICTTRCNFKGLFSHLNTIVRIFTITSYSQCEEAWNCSTVLTVQHASVSEHRHDMFVVTDTSNNQHTFQVRSKNFFLFISHPTTQ